MDQLYSRTETSEAAEATGAPPQETSGASPVPAGIMSGLPRRRPHRRSALRSHLDPPRAPVAVRAAAGAAPAAAVAPVDPVPERHLTPVASVAPAAVPPPRITSRRKALPPPSEPAPGIGRLALDGVVESAKLPWRVAGEVARQAASSIAGTLRR